MSPPSIRRLARAGLRVRWTTLHHHHPMWLLDLTRRMRRVVRREGLRGTWLQLPWMMRRMLAPRRYRRWIKRYGAIDERLRQRMRDCIDALDSPPLISVVMPVYNTPAIWLHQAIGSVQRQIYPFWELCIADDCSSAPHIRPLLESYAAADPRIKVRFRNVQGHISNASNSALEIAAGEYVALLDHDDELPEQALLLVALYAIANPDADLIYSDEDKIDEAGRRFDAYFKPDWNPDLILTQNFFSHLGVFRRVLVRRIGGFRPGLEGSQDWDLTLRALLASPSRQVVHIPHVLYNWRTIHGSTSADPAAKPYAVVSARRAVDEYLGASGSTGMVETIPGGWGVAFRIRYALPPVPPRVTIVIHVRDDWHRAAHCVRSVMQATDYAALDFLVVGAGDARPDWERELANASRSTQIRAATLSPRIDPTEWMRDQADSLERGGVLVFLDPAAEPLRPDWLEELVSQALRPGVGAVGARLIKPDDTLFQAGLILGLRNVVDPSHQGMSSRVSGYFGRTQLTQNLSAVSGICLAVQRERYLEAGASPPDPARNYADVDLCLRLGHRGYRIVWTPFAELAFRSPTAPGVPLAAKERIRGVLAKVGNGQYRDPAYNPNLNFNTADFGLAHPPRLTLSDEIDRALATLGHLPRNEDISKSSSTKPFRI